MSNTRKRYAIVGTGGRAKMFADALAGTPHRDLVALLTHNSAWAPLWWWREAVLGLLALVLLGWSGRWARRRRTRSAVAP